MTNFLFENLAHLSRSVPSKRENHTSNIETKTHCRGDFRERVGLFVPRWRSRPQVEESVVCTRMWDEWKYGYLSKLKLHFIHAGKADTRESAFRLAVVETGRERCFCVIMADL